MKHLPPASAYMAQRYADNPEDAMGVIEAALAAVGQNPAAVIKVVDSLPDTPAKIQLFITLDCLQMWGDGQQVLQAASIARTTLREVAEEGEAESASALRVFNATVRLMSSMPGDRVMVLVSPGLYLISQLQRSLGESIDRATRAGGPQTISRRPTRLAAYVNTVGKRFSLARLAQLALARRARLAKEGEPAQRAAGHPSNGARGAAGLVSVRRGAQPWLLCLNSPRREAADTALKPAGDNCTERRPKTPGPPGCRPAPICAERRRGCARPAVADPLRAT